MKMDHEKWVEIFVAFLSILFSVFAFLQISNYAVEEILLNKQIISFDFREDRSVSMPTLLRRIKNFSDKYDVEIAQYSFLSKMQIAKPNGPFCGAERPQCGASGQPFPT